MKQIYIFFMSFQYTEASDWPIELPSVQLLDCCIYIDFNVVKAGHGKNVNPAFSFIVFPNILMNKRSQLSDREKRVLVFYNGEYNNDLYNGE